MKNQFRVLVLLALVITFLAACNTQSDIKVGPGITHAVTIDTGCVMQIPETAPISLCGGGVSKFQKITGWDNSWMPMNITKMFSISDAELHNRGYVYQGDQEVSGHGPINSGNSGVDDSTGTHSDYTGLFPFPWEWLLGIASAIFLLLLIIHVINQLRRDAQSVRQPDESHDSQDAPREYYDTTIHHSENHHHHHGNPNDPVMSWINAANKNGGTFKLEFTMNAPPASGNGGKLEQ